MGNYTIFGGCENPRRGRQARNLTTNVPKILDLKSSSEQIFSNSCSWVLLFLLHLFATVLLRTLALFGHEACAFILVPGFLALQPMDICVDRGRFRTHFTSVKFSKNPSAKTLENCFIHKSSTGSAKRNEKNSYYSPPLVGKSHEDTITTHFDWKK